jgi:hypothetical protein
MAGLIVTRLDMVGSLALRVKVVKEVVAVQDSEGTVGEQDLEVEEMAKEVAVAMHCQCSVGPENMITLTSSPICAVSSSPL